MSQTLISDKLRDSYYSVVDPIITFSIRHNADPNVITSVGLIFAAFSAVFAGSGRFVLAGIFLLLSGWFDTLDGSIARRSGRVSKFGALFDSVLDRYSEMLVYFGFAFYFIRIEAYWIALAFAISLGGSLMVSYVRARAEGLGFQCKVGILQRTERILLLVFGSVTSRIMLIIAIWIIAVLSNATAIHRLFYIYQKDHERKP